MAITLTLTNPAGQILAHHNLQAGMPLRIAAADQVYYQLADESGLAPQNVQAVRSGNDVSVQFLDGQSIVIENYFLLDETGLRNPLLGMQTNGQYMAYSIAETAPVPAPARLLAEEIGAESALLAEDTAVEPLLALAGLVGIGAIGATLASDDDDGATSPAPYADSPQPQTPFNPNQPAPWQLAPDRPAPNVPDLPPSPNLPNPPAPNPPAPNPPAPNPPAPNPPAPNPPAQNQKPTDITLDNTTLAEGREGAAVGKLATIDPDAGDSHTYTVSDARFEVVNGELKLKSGQKVEFAQEPAINLVITTTDKAGASYKEAVTVTVEDDPNYPAPNPPAPNPPTDTTPPTLQISADKTTLAPGDTATLTFTLSEAVQGFEADDIAVTNGALSAFSKVSDTVYSATYTAGSAGASGINVAANRFTDLANNANTAPANLDLNISAAPGQPNQPATVQISGNLQAGQTVTATVSDGNGVPGHVKYQWFADGQPIANATGQTYQIASADVGKTLSVKAEFTDNAGHPKMPQGTANAPVKYGIYHHAVYGDYLKVEEFGADLTGKSDSIAAIKQALAAAHNEGAALNFGAGKLYISEQIKIDAGTKNVTALFGEGKENTTITFDWQQTGVYNPNTNRDDVRADAGILIDGESGKTVAHLALRYEAKTPEDFYRTNSRGYGMSYFGKINGILVSDADNTTVDSVEVSGVNRAGVMFTSAQADAGAWTHKLQQQSANPADAPWGENNKVINSHLHHNRVAGAMFAYQKNFLAEGNTLAWNGHEKDGGTGYGIASAAGSYNDTITYRGNTTDHNYRKGLDFHDGDNILIENNTINGDRQNGIAVYNRSFYMGNVKIAGNTITAPDGNFRLLKDDGTGDKDLPQEAPGERSYHGYAGIQLMPNANWKDFGNPGKGQYEISGNTIGGLNVFQNERQTFGIEFRNQELHADYTANILNNHISGAEVKNLIAILNNTVSPNDRKDGKSGVGSGDINIIGNTGDIGEINGGNAIYINEASVDSRSPLRGTVRVENNNITIREQSNGESEALQIIGNAENYNISHNVFNLHGNMDKTLIGIHGHGTSNPTLRVDDNLFLTREALKGDWLSLGKIAGADAILYGVNNHWHSNVRVDPVSGKEIKIIAADEIERLDPTDINHLFIPGGSDNTVFISPNLNTAEIGKLVALDTSQQILDYIGEVGNRAFTLDADVDSSNIMKGLNTLASQDILIGASGADVMTGGNGKDQFVFVPTGKKDAGGVHINQILDFNKNDDLIKLVAGDGQTIDNVHFDSRAKTLSYDVHDGGATYSESIMINPRQILTEDDVLKAVQII